MPRGVYVHVDPHTGEEVAVESFSCAPGPAGWRYVAAIVDPADPRRPGRVDVTVDERWRPVRVELTAGGWTVRAGIVGSEVVFTRQPTGADPADPTDEQAVAAVSVTGTSPAFAVVTARLLGLRLDGRARLRALAVTGPALAVVVRDEGWGLVDVSEHDTETRPLVVERYEVADLATADRRVVHIADDVVLDAPGLVLRELDSPPSELRRRGA